MRKLGSEFRNGKDMLRIQPFPSGGRLGKNLGLPLSELTDDLRMQQDRVYSYVVGTVKRNRTITGFEQHGSAPNFQGDVLTLCSCKHQMRAGRSCDDWKGVWLAGFTSRTIDDGRHWLFYLARIELTFESHADLWSKLNAHSRKAKSANENFLGDVFKPTTPIPTGDARFDPDHYQRPEFHTHSWHVKNGMHDGWHNDIAYRHAKRYGHPALLMADPLLTFIWDKPMIYLNENHCRNYRKWDCLTELMETLKEN
jgi:hypothetical protein